MLVACCAENSGPQAKPTETPVEKAEPTEAEAPSTPAEPAPTVSQAEPPAPEEATAAPEEKPSAPEEATAASAKPREPKVVKSKAQEKSAKTSPGGVQIANPASVHCAKQGGKLEIMTRKAGQFGVCIFKDGSRCEEWKFFRKECAPGTCRKKSGICKK
ncbi:MAG: DUF333 domain-containing protein [Proteobacteria bacterium]|nr:DUF333 domain-containing protein [Pseudomonadota bacterium]